MSKISDELREFAYLHFSGSKNVGPCDALMGIADRIDAEMVELPKDADGVPIHVGDTVWGCISGMQMVIHELGLTDRWTISTDTGFIPKASAVTHARPDSLESIARDLEDWADGNISGSAQSFADRIRKLAERED